MDEKRLDVIRRFFWNYKYAKDYNKDIYKKAVELFKQIDSGKNKPGDIT